MQFQTIIFSLALALSATAAPAPNGGSNWGQPGSVAQSKCSNGQTAACCNGVAGIAGLGCTSLNLVTLINSQCSQQQSLACCDTNGNQNGLVNVGAVCPSLIVL